jgi:predicted CXXCH cytochrome family protein
LTYFIDGVPPLGADQDDQRDANSVVENGGGEPGKEQKQIWFVHEPWKECTTRKQCREKCHVTPGAEFDASAILAKPVPELCLDCHEDFRTTQLYVHGPKIAGECLLCHERHKSKIKYLLKKEQPDLCYQCHEMLVEDPIPGHLEETKEKCTECHSPHGGSERYFLKEEAKRHE